MNPTQYSTDSTGRIREPSNAQRRRYANIRNRHVYFRDGLDLSYVSTCLTGSPESAAEEAAFHSDQHGAGKYVVIDSAFEGEVVEVAVTYKAVR